MLERNIHLPTEILLLVFDKANRDDVVAASYVSQHWRLSARSHRLCTIGLAIRISHGVDVAGQLQCSTYRLESAPLPLDLKMTITVQITSDEALWHELVSALVRVMVSPGVRKLSLKMDGIYLDTMSERLRDTPAPFLENLQLAAEFHRSTAPLGRLFANFAPELRDVSLANVAVESIASSIAFASVQRLKISSCSPDISIILSVFPVLQSLKLHSCNFKLNDMSAANSPRSDAVAALQRLEIRDVSRGPTDEKLEAVFCTIKIQNIPTVRWICDIPPPPVVVEGLLRGFPPDGLHLSLTVHDDRRNRHILKLSTPDRTPFASSHMDVLGLRVREFVFSPLSSFTLWPWIGPHRVTFIRIAYSLLSTVLQAVPAFCLPQLLEMRVQAPVVTGTSAIDFWDPQKDIARGRLLAPRLQRLTLFATYGEVLMSTVSGLVRLATQVLGLSPVDPELSVASQPDLHLVNIVVEEHGAELLGLFNKIKLEESDRI